MPGMRSGPTASRSSSRRAKREALVDHALHSLPRPAAPLSPAPLLGAGSPFGTVARGASGRTASVAIALRSDPMHSDETIELARGEEPSLDLAADGASDTDQRLFDVTRFLAGSPIKPGWEKGWRGSER